MESPLIDGPVPGTATTWLAPYDLGELGYTEEEHFVSGTAQAYEIIGERGADGRWSVSPTVHADYATRLVVRRPLDSHRFNGTVVVEWLNVSGGTDAEPCWGFMHRHIIRNGFTWVGVSAQRAGIEGGGFVEGPHLKSVAPDRYERLSHPGDAFSYDIFSQVGRMLGESQGSGPLGPLAADRLIAIGESQSAAFLVTYVNAIDPVAQVYDGYLVHSRGARGANLDGWRPMAQAAADGSGPDLRAARAAIAAGERIRDDVRVPVLILQSETDVASMGGDLARQPDGERLRLWEVAGTAHADSYMIGAATRDTGALSAVELAALLQPTGAEVAGVAVQVPVNSGPQQHYVSQAALERIDRWVRDGTAPPMAPRLELAETGGGFVLDQNGIAAGGIRTPWVDVPTAVLSGLGQEGGAGFTFLFGTTRAFSAEKLAALYPGGRDSYLAQFGRSLDVAVAQGFLLDADTGEMRALAAAAYSTPA
jgi:Alpha/beta hydrolase domain